MRASVEPLARRHSLLSLAGFPQATDVRRCVGLFLGRLSRILGRPYCTKGRPNLIPSTLWRARSVLTRAERRQSTHDGTVVTKRRLERCFLRAILLSTQLSRPGPLEYSTARSPKCPTVPTREIPSSPYQSELGPTDSESGKRRLENQAVAVPTR